MNKERKNKRQKMNVNKLSHFLTKYQALYPDVDIEVKLTNDLFGNPQITIEFPEPFITEIITLILKPFMGNIKPMNLLSLVNLFDLKKFNISEPEGMEEILNEIDISYHKLMKLINTEFPDNSHYVLSDLVSHLFFLGSEKCRNIQHNKIQIYWTLDLRSEDEI